jgi:molybdate transport system ATP-binding protein
MVLLTRAMVKDPELLILDEPCQGLDPKNRLRVLDLIERIGARTAAAVIFVTHYPEEIMPCITHELVFEPAPDGGYRTLARRR